MRSVGNWVYLWIACLAVLLSGCDSRAGNPAPPRIDTEAELPKKTSTITVPLTIDISGLESKLNNSVPQRLWAINQHERKCIPAQRVTVCAVHKTKCKGDACKNVPCKIGFKKTKITPDVACTIVGQVTRGRIRLGGEGDVLMLTMPVSAVISARDVSGIIKRETANASADVRARVRILLSENWTPRAKVDIAYDWREPPGINFLGQRIRFVRKADAELAKVIAGLERDLTAEIGRVQTRAIVEGAWREGFATILLNRERPPAWMRVAPRKLDWNGYRIEGRKLTMTLSAEALTETFIGDEPERPQPTPLPKQSKMSGNHGLRFHIPVLADYSQLEPVILRALKKLAAKGISLDQIGLVQVEFKKVTVYPTENGRIAVGVEASADVIRSPLKGTNGVVWLSAKPFNEANSQLVNFRDLKIAGRTDREAVNLLFALFEDPEVLAEISKALTTDFNKDYAKVVEAAKKAIAMRQEGDFLLSAEVDEIGHGTVIATGQGLFLPVEVKGKANIRYNPGSKR